MRFKTLNPPTPESKTPIGNEHSKRNTPVFFIKRYLKVFRFTFKYANYIIFLPESAIP